MNKKNKKKAGLWWKIPVIILGCLALIGAAALIWFDIQYKKIYQEDESLESYEELESEISVEFIEDSDESENESYPEESEISGEESEDESSKSGSSGSSAEGGYYDPNQGNISGTKVHGLVNWKDYSKAANKTPDGITNILLIGYDESVLHAKTWGRSDVMIVASIDERTGEVSLTSIARDIATWDPWRQKVEKLNTGTAYHSVSALLSIIKMNYDIDIDYYISVEFRVFTDIIDAMGGLDLYVTATEARIINYSGYFGSNVDEYGDSDDPVVQHTLTYMIDGVLYAEEEYYTDEEVTMLEPTKAGYSFDGWDQIITVMPNEDVIVRGSFTALPEESSEPESEDESSDIESDIESSEPESEPESESESEPESSEPESIVEPESAPEGSEPESESESESEPEVQAATTKLKEVNGVQHLNGQQVLSYARIRSIDNDISRQNRQRTVIKTAVERAKKMGFAKTWKIASDFLTKTQSQYTVKGDRRGVRTNIASPYNLMYKAFTKYIKYTINSYSIPVAGTYKGGTMSGQWMYSIDYKANIDWFYQNVYHMEHEG